jgi:ABC-2 type transport system ATP-binding protein
VGNLGGVDAVIETSSLSRRYGSVVALDDVTVRIEPGITGLVGSNGAGKSTLLKILLGLQPPSGGRASVLGRDVAVDDGSVRRHVGYMPEHDCLPRDASAADFLVRMARLSGLPPAVARERASDTLRHVGLHDERYRPVGEFSTGMKQRVKLAQALVHDPDLVLLDEPTNGLDPAGRDEMLTLVERIGREFGISVLVTSHLLRELERTCDSIVVLDAGRLDRVSSVTDMTTTTRTALVEVTDRAEELVDLLVAAGRGARIAGSTVELEVEDDSDYDLVRDGVVDLGVGLVRIQLRRHRVAELFGQEVGDATG